MKPFFTEQMLEFYPGEYFGLPIATSFHSMNLLDEAYTNGNKNATVFAPR
ncbi:MAG: hypothetical protein KME08_06560 [Aphanothece sp. CMT-3BRIN-NPC111]|jgi:hypothetical protein|nr:hypothetical protein [Aphanothece sp. CMT-3BRIN-NPC111]